MAKRKRRIVKRRPIKRRGKKNAVHTKRLIVALFVAVAAFVFLYLTYIRLQRVVFHSFDDSPYSDAYFVRGVDVSHHNSFINWNRLREEDVTFAYLKATEGTTHIDRDYLRNYKLAREAGLKVGTYHFYTFAMDGEAQAQHFIRHAQVYTGDMLPAIDVEHSAINKPAAGKEARKRVVDELKVLENKLFEYYGKHPVIYTNKNCYRIYIDGNFPHNPLWICDLHSPPDEASDKWVIWQFSHTGNIPGVDGDVDLNFYRHSFVDFRNLLMP